MGVSASRDRLTVEITQARSKAHLAAQFASNAVHERANTARADQRFATNSTVFGQLLRGEIPSKIMYEDEDVVCFRDIRPVSDHHTLVIPKRYIENIGHATTDDIELLKHMVNVAEKVLQAEYPLLEPERARADELLSQGFHRWPMLSVHHLHLHTIYPMPCKKWYYSWLHPQSYGPLYTSAAKEIKRLAEKQNSDLEIN